MEQATFSELDHDLKKWRTQRETFLEKMDGLFRGTVWRSASSRSTRSRAGRAGRIRCGRGRYAPG